MPRAYLYLSTAKLDQLIDQESSFFANLSARIDFKLPFVSGGVSGANQSRNIAKLERIEKKLRGQYSIPSFDAIPAGSAPVFISFKGRAVRSVQYDGFWLAVDHPHTALLLAGSASFAMGQAAAKPEEMFSPSGDPVGAFKQAFSESNKELLDHSSAWVISYVWMALMSDALRSHASLPSVEGLAIFATTLRATGKFDRARRPDMESLVVGTPLYVRQVEDQPAVLSPEEEKIEKRKRFLVSVSTVGGHADANMLNTLVQGLHRYGYRISEDKWFSSDFFLAEYRRSGRWNRAFVIFKSGNRDLAEEVRSFIDEHQKIQTDLVSLEEVVKINGDSSEKLFDEDADVAVAVGYE